MDPRLNTPFRALQIAVGLTATLAGFDKFFNILADWGGYLSPFASDLLPLSVGTFMAIVGVVEIAVGATILAVAPRIGAYAASAWLLLVAANLAIAGYFDVAVRDIVMSIAAFTLARSFEVRARVPVLTNAVATPRSAIASRGAIALVIAFGTFEAQAAAQMPPASHHPSTVTLPSATLRQDMRKLWTDHVIWTRAYVVAAIDDQPDALQAAPD